MFKILYILTILKIFSSKCLDKKRLTNFGWKPLKTAKKLENPLLCQKIYSKSKTCIEQKNFQTFLSNIHTILLEQKTKKYTELHDLIENLSIKFILLKKKLVNKFIFRKSLITENARKSLDEVMPFLPKNPLALRKKILVNQNKCLNAQMKVIIGSYCVLSSEKATNNTKKELYIKKEKKELGFKTDEGIDNELKRFYGMKVEEKASDKVIKACFPYVQGICLFKKIYKALDDLENLSRSSKKENKICEPKVLECKKIKNCSINSKNQIFELIFNKKKQNEIKTEEINRVKQVLNEDSWYEYIKKSLLTSKKTITKKTDIIFQKLQNFVEILERNTIDLFVVEEKGIDLVVEGENSGINIESSEAISIVFGSCFIVLQLFV